MEFKVEIRTADWNKDVTVISVSGSVDAQTAPIFERDSLAAVRKGKKKILVDCKGLDFISSAGIGVFMVILSEVEGDGYLKVMNLTDEVFESFDLLGIPEVIEIHKDEKEARKACA